MEVFAISGASGSPNTCPPGWEATPHGNCGAPAGGCAPSMRSGKACRSQVAIDLQNALRALGQAVGDASIAKIAVDGFVGPETTAAVNRAFTKHIGPGQSPAPYRTGKLTIANVAQNAAAMTNAVKAEVGRRGKTVPPSPPVSALPPEAPAAPLPDASPSAIPVLALIGLNVVASAAGAWMAWRRAA